MTGRVQTLRSNTSGVRPTGEQPGTLFVNWADGQFSVVNSVNGAQDLIGVRFFNTAAIYAVGDFVVQGGQLYRAIAVSSGGAFVPANWTQLGGASTVPGINDNRIINGDMRIDQRNNGNSGAAINAYTVDRWVYAATQASKGTWGRNGPSVTSGAFGFPYYLGFSSSSALTPAATDFFVFAQNIEADMVSDFAWGTAGAQSVTLSFWASCTLIGTFSGTIRNYAGTRSYPFTYSLPAPGLTKIVVIIPGDTAGTWVMGGNAGSVIVTFDLGGGANVRGPAGVWAAGNFTGANGAVNVVGTNGAQFALTGVKLEIGSVATP